MIDFMWTLLFCSISMTGLALCVKVLSPFLEKHYSGKVRYYIWLVLMAGLLIPFRPSFPKTIVEVPVSYQNAGRWNHLNQTAANQNTAIQNEVTPNQILSEVDKTEGASLTESASLTKKPEEPNQAAQGTMQNIESVRFSVNPEMFLFLLWLLGGAGYIGVNAYRHWRFSSWVKRWGTPIVDNRIQDLADAIASRRKIKGHVQLIHCEGIASPMLYGIVRPVILLPQMEYRDEAYPFILEHELVHFKRRDIWWKTAMMAASAMHWFNPFLYIMRKETGMLCEISCDEEVLQEADSSARYLYTETIIGVIRNKTRLETVLSTSFYGGKEGMKKRITSIMDTNKKRAGALILALSLAATVGTGAVLAAERSSEELIPWNEVATISGMSSVRRETKSDEAFDKEMQELLGPDYQDMTLDEIRKAMESQEIGEDAGGEQESGADKSEGDRIDGDIKRDSSNAVSGGVNAPNAEAISITSLLSRNFLFDLEDSDGREISVDVGYSFKEEIKDPTAITWKEYDAAMRGVQLEVETLAEGKNLDFYRDSQSGKMLEDEIRSAVSRIMPDHITLSEIELQFLYVDDEVTYMKQEEDGVIFSSDSGENNGDSDYKRYAEESGYKYMKLDFPSTRQTNEEMTKQFEQYGYTAKDTVLAEFSDGSYTLYAPSYGIPLTALCAHSNAAYYAKVFLTVEGVQKFTSSELETAAEQSEDIVMEILGSDSWKTGEELSEQLKEKLGQKLGIDEEWLTIQLTAVRQ